MNKQFWLGVLSRESNNGMRCVSNSISAETIITLCITFLRLNTMGPFTCTMGHDDVWGSFCKYQSCSPLSPHSGIHKNTHQNVTNLFAVLDLFTVKNFKLAKLTNESLPKNVSKPSLKIIFVSTQTFKLYKLFN